MSDPHGSYDELLRRAQSLGLLPCYADIWGNHHAVSDETLRALLPELAYRASAHTPPLASASETSLPAVVLQHSATQMNLWLHGVPNAETLSGQIELEHASTPVTVTVVRANADAQHGAPPFILNMTRDGERHAGDRSPRSYGGDEIETARCFTFRWSTPLPPGFHRLRLRMQRKDMPVDEWIACQVVATPDTCFEPAPLAQGERLWGMAIQLYALRSERNWGIGDFTDLGDLGAILAPLGVDLIGLNPLHALYPIRPEHCSPYSPSTRLFINPLYIDVADVAEQQGSVEVQKQLDSASFRAEREHARAGDLIDYGAVSALKQKMLEACFHHFRAQHYETPSDLGKDFQSFVQREGERLQRYAHFEVLQERRSAGGRSAGPWQDWPAELRHPSSAQVLQAVEACRDRILYHTYLQWWADRQLATAQERILAAGMRVGIYRDLAVGSDTGGSDTWSDSDHYACSVSVGAPPDDFNLQGQDWGLPPVRPASLAVTGFSQFIAALRQNMRHAGALRVDHAMGMFRLFWIPPGRTAMQGAYVRYPADDLFGLIALESHRHGCLIIGEDLGTVPDEVRQLMDRYGAYSYRILWFEREHDGEIKAPAAEPRRATVTAATHDIPTLVGYWTAHDLDLRAKLAMFSDSAQADHQRHLRYEDKKRLLRALAREGLLPDGVDPNNPPASLDGPLRRAAQTYLARSTAGVMMVQMDDVLGLREQVNLPGTVDEHPNWRRRFPLPIEEWAAHPEMEELVRCVGAARGQAARSHQAE